MKPLYIGIDPGKNTGFAVYDPELCRLVAVETLLIHQAMERVLALAGEHRLPGRGVVVVFEDPRRRKWIPLESSWKEAKGRAFGAGSVKRDATIWEDFLTDKDITYIHPAPAKGLTKWSQDYFEKITGWSGRTSHNARDAAALVFGR